MPSFCLDLFRQFGQLLLIVAEDLHFDRRRIAFEIAQHVLQQLDEFDLGIGHRLVSLSRSSVMTSSAIPAAFAARLEPHEHVAAVHLRREHAELGSGPAHVGRDLRRLREDRFDLLQPRVRLLERHPRRRDVVDDESALVGGRQKARAHRQVGGDSRAGRARAQSRSASSRPLRAARAASRRTSGRARRRAVVVRRLGRMPARYAALASSGIRNSASTSEISTATDSVIDSALKKSPTTPDSSPSGANTTTVVSVDPTIGATSSLGRRLDRLAAAALRQAPMDVLDHDHRIVDDQADGHRHAAHRHQVDRLAEQPHEEERRDDGQRQRAGGHQRQPPVAQEHEQHEHREAGADQDRVADVGDRALDELGEVVGLRRGAGPPAAPT